MDCRDILRCDDCGVEEGELHNHGCQMEDCPRCGERVLDCNCFPDDDPPDDERIPHVQIPVLCALCAAIGPDLFKVSDEDWNRIVPKNLRDKKLCGTCFDYLEKFSHQPSSSKVEKEITANTAPWYPEVYKAARALTINPPEDDWPPGRYAFGPGRVGV